MLTFPKFSRHSQQNFQTVDVSNFPTPKAAATLHLSVFIQFVGDFGEIEEALPGVWVLKRWKWHKISNNC
jgi:hypothetical protein